MSRVGAQNATQIESTLRAATASQSPHSLPLTRLARKRQNPRCVNRGRAPSYVLAPQYDRKNQPCSKLMFEHPGVQYGLELGLYITYRSGSEERHNEALHNGFGLRTVFYLC